VERKGSGGDARALVVDLIVRRSAARPRQYPLILPNSIYFATLPLRITAVIGLNGLASLPDTLESPRRFAALSVLAANHCGSTMPARRYRPGRNHPMSCRFNKCRWDTNILGFLVGEQVAIDPKKLGMCIRAFSPLNGYTRLFTIAAPVLTLCYAASWLYLRTLVTRRNATEN
jgi:hypothetical protein